MDTNEFRVRGKEMVDYMCDYMETLPSRRVTPSVTPGYLRPQLPGQAPAEPEPWDKIMADVESKIMPGIAHWQHPSFHAYFPAGNSYPSILGDMLSDIIGCIGFSWAASPACTELETIVLDWFGKAIGLPETFLSSTKGGGVIQGSASECILVCMLAARAEALKVLHEKDPDTEKAALLPKLVAYCSKESHSCVEKAAMISLVKLRILEPDDDNSLRGEIVRKALEEDEANGLVPFFVCATLGTTGSCSFDNLQEIGPVCKSRPNVWLHVDAAYAGNSFICPEFRHWLTGVEHFHSMNTNTNKWLLVNFDCSCLWVTNREKLMAALVVDPIYLQHEHEREVFDYRHWGIPLSRRFRALKLWFVFRSYGINGLQAYIRNHIKLARRFENHVLKDKRFDVMNDVRLGLVCFRLKDSDKLTQDLLANINHSGKLHMVPALIKGKYIIRFCVVAQHATEKDIDFAWSVIQEFASDLEEPAIPGARPRIPSTPHGRKLTRQFSFTRSVSKDVYKRSLSRSSLYDGATPIVVQDDDDEDTNVFDECFQNALPIKEE